MPRAQPHVITRQDIVDADQWVVCASSEVAHSGKQKRLWGAVGRREWIVRIAGEAIYRGGSLRDAVNAYNEAG